MREVAEHFLVSFGKTTFWENRYKNLNVNSKDYDWYIGYNKLLPILLQHVPFFQQIQSLKEKGELAKVIERLGYMPRVLHLGCGNSSLPEKLWNDGLKLHSCIDFCEHLIEVMKGITARKGFEGIEYFFMDARGLTFATNTFDMVIDKGTIDSMVCTDDPAKYIDLTSREVARVLKPGGYFVVVSCAVNEARLKLLQKSDYCWQLEQLHHIKTDHTKKETFVYALVFKYLGHK